MEKIRKLINFDLDTNQLKYIYSNSSGKDYTNAYKELKAFFKKEDFEWRQRSCYISNNELSIVDVASLVKKVRKTFPWLVPCTKKLDVTNIGRQFDLTPILNGEEFEIESLNKKYDKGEKVSVQEETTKYVSLNDMMLSADDRRKESLKRISPDSKGIFR